MTQSAAVAPPPVSRRMQGITGIREGAAHPAAGFKGGWGGLWQDISPFMAVVRKSASGPWRYDGWRHSFW